MGILFPGVYRKGEKSGRKNKPSLDSDSRDGSRIRPLHCLELMLMVLWLV